MSGEHRRPPVVVPARLAAAQRGACCRPPAAIADDRGGRSGGRRDGVAISFSIQRPYEARAKRVEGLAGKVLDGSPAACAGRDGLAARTGRVGIDGRLRIIFVELVCSTGDRRSAATPIFVGVVPPGRRCVRSSIMLGLPLYSLITFGGRPRPTAGPDHRRALPRSLTGPARFGCPAVPPRSVSPSRSPRPPLMLHPPPR